MEERHAQTVKLVWEKMESDKAEITQKTQEGNQILTLNLMKMCEDLATRVTSSGGDGGGGGTGLSPMQERKFEKMLETHSSGWELRTTTFLEKMAESYVKEFERVMRSVDRLQADQDTKERKLEKKMAEKHEQMQKKMTENQKEMHKYITDTQTGMQDLIVQTINPLIGKVNAVQVQEQEISAVKEDLKNLVGQVEQGFKILTVAAKSQLAQGEREGSVPLNPPGHGAEGTCHTLQVPQAGGG